MSWYWFGLPIGSTVTKCIAKGIKRSERELQQGMCSPSKHKNWGNEKESAGKGNDWTLSIFILIFCWWSQTQEPCLLLSHYNGPCWASLKLPVCLLLLILTAAVAVAAAEAEVSSLAGSRSGCGSERGEGRRGRGRCWPFTHPLILLLLGKTTCWPRSVGG